MQISGVIISPDILEIMVTVFNISVLKPIAELKFPEAIIAEEYTGTKPSIKSEHSSITAEEDSRTFFIGKIKIEQTERVATALIICPDWEEFL